MLDKNNERNQVGAQTSSQRCACMCPCAKSSSSHVAQETSTRSFSLEKITLVCHMMPLSQIITSSSPFYVKLNAEFH